LFAISIPKILLTLTKFYPEEMAKTMQRLHLVGCMHLSDYGCET